jgi:hypothetical protein
MASQRRFLLRKLLVAFALVLLLAACGGDADPEDSPETDLNLETDPSGELGGKLLAVGDMPAGWQPVDSAGSGGATDQGSGFCNEPVPDETNSSASATAQFSKDQDTNQVIETVVSYENPEQATEAFDKVQQTIGTCKEWDVEDAGTVSHLKLSGATFPNVADQTAAARVTSEFPASGGTGGFVTGDTVIVRKQNHIVVVRHFAIGIGGQPTFNAADTEPIVRSAVQKV